MSARASSSCLADLHPAANRLTEDEQACYAYDLNGNVASKTAKVAGACTGGVTAYTFDAEDRLVRIDFPGGGFAEYRYDGLGRRIQKDVDSVVTRYVYDGADILLEYDGANVLVARYTHGPGIDDPVQLDRDLDASGFFEAAERFTYHADGLGSIVALTDSTGTVARAYVYDAYGRIVDETGTLANPFTYTGREFDAESGLYFYRARYYDASLGRFVTEDRIGFAAGDENLYRYVFSNPVNLIDPDGEVANLVIGAVIGGIVGAGLDLGGQLLANGGRFDCIDTDSLIRSGVVGALGGAFGVGTSSVATNAAFGGVINAAAGGNPVASGGFVQDFTLGAVLGASGTLGSTVVTTGKSAAVRGLRQGLADAGANVLSNAANLRGGGSGGGCECGG